MGDFRSIQLVRLISMFKVIWTLTADFAKATLTNIIDTNDEIKPDEVTDLDDDIDYETAGEYTLSDGAKVEVSGGEARLKATGGEDSDWPFDTPANYTYVGADIDVVGGEARLKPQAANTTFIASYRYNTNGTYGVGDITGTAVCGASVVSNKLDLSYNDLRYVDYDAVDNADSQQVGCIRFILTPNYTSPPSVTRVFLSIGNATGSLANLLQIQQQNNSNLRFVMYDKDDNLVVLQDTSQSFTAGISYEIEFNWNLTTGANRIFVDGVQLGATETSTGTRDGNINFLRVGSNGAATGASDFKINNVIVFDAVQHTSNYTPSALEPFLTTDPDIIPNTGLAFTAALDQFVETATINGNDEIKYQVSSDDGTTFKWWNGSAWIARTLTSVVTAVNTTVGNVDAGNLASLQTLDASTYDVSEVGGNPGFTIEMNMANVDAAGPDNIVIHGYYDGGHTNVDVDIWDYNLGSWVTLGQMATSGGSVVEQSFAVTGSKSDKVQDGVVQTRINHDEMGNASHNIFLDYVYADAIPTDGWWYDNESNSATDVNTNIGSLANSGTFKFKAFLHSFDGEDTPRLSNIYVASPLMYSTTDNLYIDTKDTGQIDATDVIAWLTTTFTESKPANTSIRVMFSNDGRVSWLSWNGSSWAAPASATTRTDGTSIATAETNLLSLPVGTNDSLDVRIFLNTTDSSVRPLVSNINFTGDKGFEISGTWESDSFDGTVVGLEWGVVAFSTTIPGGTTITVTARAGDASDLSGESYSSALSNGGDLNLTGRYIQFKVVFTGIASARAILDELTAEYQSPQAAEVSP